MKKASAVRRPRFIWKFGKRYLPAFLLAEVCILISYAVSVALPYNLKLLTDQVLFGSQQELLPQVIQNYLILFLTASAANMLYAFVWQYLHNHYIVDIKNEMFRKTLYAKASFLSHMNSGDVISRIDADSEQFIFVIQRNLFHFVNSLIMCIAILWIVAAINPVIALLLIAAAALPIIITRLFSILTEKYAAENRKTLGGLTGRLFDLIKGLRELRLACAGWWMNRRLLSPLKRLVALGNRLRSVSFLVDKSIYLINLLASFLIYGYSAMLILQDKMTVGLFLAVIQYVALLHKKLNWMMQIYLDWFARKISIDRTIEILSLEEEKKDGVKISRIDSVQFQNVSFSYRENTPILTDVSFKIQAGQRIGLAGRSGIGKTTLAALLMQFYEPQSGQILLNGIPLEQVDPASFRRLIGSVSQDILLFDETVRYNLSLGQAVPDADLWKVLETVGLKQTVEMLPQGLDTLIGGPETDLSGGQKQRLMIARVLLKQPQFLILDEATSALDLETEQQILRALSALPGHPTMLIISHRPAALEGCDKVFALEETRLKLQTRPAEKGR